jgi:hypothetical protein
MRVINLLIIVGLILGTISCSNKTNSQAAKQIKNSDLFSLFRDIQAENLHVWAKSDKPNGDKFQGKMIDTVYFPLFGNFMDQFKQYYTDPKTKITKYSGYYLYACYKFIINDHLLGLLIREPSQYEESAIGLWIYDSKTDKLTKSVDLADGFGDENWYFNKDSWIQKSTNSLRVITRQLDHEINETTSIDSIISDQFEFYNFESDQFVKVDTLEISKIDFKLFDEK